MDIPTRIFKAWRIVVLILSSEWVLTKWKIPNGGAAVLFRSLVSSVLIFALILAVLNAIDPTRTWEFSGRVLQQDIVDKFAWFGIIFGALYTALYARFSSQWSYLANLYNSIKRCEAASGDSGVVADWKAGFIEDADNLHMVGKTTFVSVIKAWSLDSSVESCFLSGAVGGEAQWNRIMRDVETSMKIVKRKYQPRGHGGRVGSERRGD